MAIQIRRGNYADFDPTKMVAGEFAVCLDNGYVYITLSPGNSVRLGTAETIEEALEMAEAYMEDAEAFAKGTRGGVPVSSTDPAYHNNSKYYSEQAEGAEENGLISEGYAVGNQHGTPVGSSSPYYHNNSKYYCEKAEEYKDEAEAIVGIGIATTQTAGIVKPDGTSITVDSDGTIHGETGTTFPVAVQGNQNGNNSFAIGNNIPSTALNTSSIALGTNANANRRESIAIGRNAIASAYYAIAIGTNVNANGVSSTAIGYTAVASSINSIAIGNAATANESNSIAIGFTPDANGVSSIAIGVSACATGNSSIALGISSIANSESSIAIGNGAKTNDFYAIAIGGFNNANGQHSIALGSYTKANANESTALGLYANASENGATALGRSANAGGVHSTSVGYHALVSSTETNTMRLGDDYLSALKCKVSLTVTSDERDKTDFADVTDALEFINALKPITYVSNERSNYAYNEEDMSAEDKELYRRFGAFFVGGYDHEEHKKGSKKGERRRIGLKAQQIQDAMTRIYGSPSYANLVDDVLYDVEDVPKGVEGQLTVSYERFVPFLIKAVQELTERVKEIEKHI